MLLEKREIRRTFAGILGQAETPTTPIITPVATPVVTPVPTPVVTPVPTPTPAARPTPTPTPRYREPIPATITDPTERLKWIREHPERRGLEKPPFPYTGARYEKHLEDHARSILRKSSGYEYSRGISAARLQQVITSAVDYEHRTSQYNIPRSDWERKIREVAANWDFYLGGPKLTTSQARSKLNSLTRLAKSIFQKAFDKSIKKRADHLVAGRWKSIDQRMMDGYADNAAEMGITAVEDHKSFIMYGDEHWHATGGKEGISPENKYIIRTYLDFTGRNAAEDWIASIITPAYYRPLAVKAFKKYGIKLSAAAVTPAVTPAAFDPATWIRKALATTFWSTLKREGHRARFDPSTRRRIPITLAPADYTRIIDRVVREGAGQLGPLYRSEMKTSPPSINKATWTRVAMAYATEQGVIRREPAVTPALTPPVRTPVTPAVRTPTTPARRGISRANLIRRIRQEIRKALPRGRKRLTPAEFDALVTRLVTAITQIITEAGGLSGCVGCLGAMEDDIRAMIIEALKAEGVTAVTPAVTPTRTPAITPPVTPVLTPPVTPLPPEVKPTPPVKRKRPVGEARIRQKMINEAFSNILKKHNLALRSPAPVYLQMLQWRELIGDLVAECQRLSQTKYRYAGRQRALYGGIPGISQDEAIAELKARNYYPFTERPRDYVYTPTVTPVPTPVRKLTPREIQELLNKWAARAPMYANYEECRIAGEAATGGTPDRWTQCITRGDVIIQAVSNALDQANMSTRRKKRGITRREFDTLAQNAKQIANVMIAQKTYTPKIRGKQLRLYQ